jgi:hypothetical protein
MIIDRSVVTIWSPFVGDAPEDAKKVGPLHTATPYPLVTAAVDASLINQDVAVAVRVPDGLRRGRQVFFCSHGHPRPDSLSQVAT